FVFTWHPSHLPRPRAANAKRLLGATEKWWTQWSAQCTYEARDRALVQRSLVVLKALQYRPTGGIVAAPTTSLPESIGGIRNWDYRYCWLRDATFTLYALQISGYAKEAQQWQEWLLRAVAGKPSDLQIMYGVAGERLLPESELPWLPGYEGSRPVRIGNAAHAQFQLDVYGEIMDSIHVSCAAGEGPNGDVRALQKEIIAFIEQAWTRPDEGLWEVRGPRRHFTHSKVMAWVAVDRAIRAAERFNLPGPIEEWKRLRQEIHFEVCDRGFDNEKNTFVQYFGGTDLDASLLMIPLVGFLPPNDPRVVGTVDAVQRELSEHGLLHRYTVEKGVDGLPGDDGAFLICSFWLADNLQLIGRKDEARKLFKRLTSLTNDVGLLSEEYDPVAKRMLGNFPQAISHVGLVNTAHNLNRPARGPALQRPQGTADE
ncbi:MAG: glycoside hydrolase family 15 protein, partial [Tepidiformaceae bacterium]